MVLCMQFCLFVVILLEMDDDHEGSDEIQTLHAVAFGQDGIAFRE